MSRRFVIILVVLVTAFFGFLLFNKKDKSTTDSGGSTSTAELSNHIYSQGSSGVTLIEYGDFQCPACYQYFPIVAQVKDKYKDKVTFQFRHYPLVEIHQNALIGAKAAEAAGLQGKFWEMHDALYTNQQEWSGSTNPQPFFEKYAKTIELDLERFKSDMKSDSVNATVQADRGEAKKQGYSGTPAFVLNGEYLKEPPRDVEGFSKLLDEAIAKQSNQQ